MAYTTIDDPSVFFQTALYTGNAGTQTITNDGNSDLQPDFLWFKERSVTGNHQLINTVSGINKKLMSNSSNGESTQTNYVTAIGSDTFSIGNNNGLNQDSVTNVCWQWKTGTSFTNDASSTSVGTIDSAGSVNTTAGISIISYTGTGTAGTFAHGLNAVPKMMILKRNDGNGWSWIVYHVSMGNTKRTVLNNTGAAETVDYFQDTSPTSTVFSIKTNGNVNGSGGSYIAYLFAEKQGFSKFGSYVGNNSTNGTFVYTGFKPAFVMAKRTDGGTEGWSIFDNKRSTSGANLIDDFLVPNDNVAEVSQNVCDFVSNGFKFRHVDGKYHNNGGTYMYMAFAENPFVTSESIPATAR